MAIRNINTIQNPADLSYILSYTNEYMYESLANLGQRFSVKGDGIVSNYFTPLDTVNLSVEHPENYIGKLTEINNKLYILFYNKEDIVTPIYSEEIKYSIVNAVYSDTPIKLNTKINGIDYYKDDMLIYCDSVNDVLTICSLGCDTELGIVELNLEHYNTKNNILINSVKLIDTNDDNYYFIYHLEYIEDEAQYVVCKYKINKIDVTAIYGTFQKYALSLYSNTIKSYYKEYEFININDIFYEIIQFNYINALGVDFVNVEYNEDYKGFVVPDEYKSELQGVLTFIYNQYIYMYKFIFEYYCDNVYKLDNNQLNKYILFNIWKKGIEECYNEKYSVIKQYRSKDFELYIPVDYRINYYCRDTDKFYIYANETPVNIFYSIGKFTHNYIVNFFGNDEQYNNSILLANHKQDEKIILYKFSVNYNSSDSKIINGLFVDELYTTPYIYDNYWYINSQKTNYKAVGEDAGNPNIILVYTNNISNTENYNNNYRLLSTINNEVLNSLEWRCETVKVNLLEYIDISTKTSITNDIYSVKFLIPAIDEYNLDVQTKLKNSLIINLSDINNVITRVYNNDNNREKQQIKEIFGDKAFITTFWVFDKSLHKFVNVANPKNPALSLSLSNLSNINSIINNQTITKLSEFISDPELTNKIVFYKSKYSTDNIETKNTNGVGKETTIYTYSYLYNKNVINSNTFDNTHIVNKFQNPLLFTLEYEHVGIDHFINSDNVMVSNELTANSYLDVFGQYSEQFIHDYVPSYSTPFFNLSEVFTFNQNTLNRINICSFNKTGNPYYSYIGTSIYDEDKSVLHIGTSYTNLHVGDTLYNPNNKKTFRKQNTLSIDFDNVIIAGNLQLLNGKINSTTYYNNINSVQLKYEYELDPIYNDYDNCAYLVINNIKTNSKYVITHVTNTSTTETHAKRVYTYKTDIISDSNLITHVNLVLLPIQDIINVVINKDIVFTDDVLTSNMDIIKIGDNRNQYYVLTKIEHLNDNRYTASLTINYNLIKLEDETSRATKLEILHNNFTNCTPIHVSFIE